MFLADVRTFKKIIILFILSQYLFYFILLQNHNSIYFIALRLEWHVFTHTVVAICSGVARGGQGKVNVPPSDLKKLENVINCKLCSNSIVVVKPWDFRINTLTTYESQITDAWLSAVPIPICIITSDKRGGKCVCPRSFVCLSVC